MVLTLPQNTTILTTKLKLNDSVGVLSRHRLPASRLKSLTNRPVDLQNHIWSMTLEGKLGLSPLAQKNASPGRVLDVGTGTGIWAIDFGDEHPDSQVSSLGEGTALARSHSKRV